jgi:hypothetical protein
LNTTLYSSFRRLGWGFVFTIVDFRIVFFDLMPDFIGYIMIVSALHKMSSIQSVFNKAKWVAIAMIFLAIPQVLMKSNVALSDFSSIPLMLHLYPQALLALHVLLVFWIFNGLGAMAQQAHQTVLLDSVYIRKILYLVIYISQLIFYPFLLNLDDSWNILLIVLVVLSLIMELLFIRLPFRFSKIISRPIDSMLIK